MADRAGAVAVRSEAKKALSRTSERSPLPGKRKAHVNQILALQQTVGNQAVQRLMKSGMLQAKLRINRSNDIYEQEADRVAEKIIQVPEFPCPVCGIIGEGQPDNKVSAKYSSTRPVIQFRKKGEEESIQTSQIPGPAPELPPELGSRILELQGQGQPLAPSLRGFFEQSFGHDFRHVRVHTGTDAASLAESIHAKAFTTSSDIVFGVGQYAPGSTEGRRLLAHELTHVVQQGGEVRRITGEYPPTIAVSSYDNAGRYGNNPITVHRHSGEPQVQRATREDEEKTGAKTGFGEYVKGFLKAIDPRELINLKELALSLLGRYAPELVSVIRQGPVSWLKDKITSAAELVFNSLAAPVKSAAEPIQTIHSHFTRLVDWMSGASKLIAQGECKPMNEALEHIHKIIEGIASPVVDGVKRIAGKVKDYFVGLWDRFGVPAWEFLKQAGGKVWEGIKNLGSLIWEKTAPIRESVLGSFKSAWEWIKERLGMDKSEESSGGVLTWIQKKAQSIWDDHIKPFIERHKKPLKVVAAAVAALSPAGPIIAVGVGFRKVIEGISLIRQHMFKREGVVEQRGILEGVIIPGFTNALKSVRESIKHVAGFISGKLNEVLTGLGDAVGAVAGSVFQFLSGILEFLVEKFQSLAQWSTEKLNGLAEWIHTGFEGLVHFLQPVKEFLHKVGAVIGDIFQIQAVVLGKAWNAIPACIRKPFMDFLTNQILKRIPILKQVVEVLPEIWGKLKATALNVIHKVFRDGDLKGAAFEIFKLVLDALKIPLELVKEVIARAGTAMDLILGNPIDFLLNAFGAIKQGFKQYGANIWDHLVNGFKNWLLGNLTKAGIKLPEDLSLKSIFFFALDVLDITAENILKRLEDKISQKFGPEKAATFRKGVKLVSKIWDYIGNLLREGPAGIWEIIKEKVGNLWSALLDGAISYIIEKVTTGALKKLAAALTGPVGVIVNGLTLIYDVIVAMGRYARQMLEILNNIFGSAIDIAKGVISKAATMIEDALDRALPVALGFLAQFLGFGDISTKIRDMVQKIRDRVNLAIDWVIERALAVGAALLGAVKGIAGKIKEFLFPSLPFEAGGESHTLGVEKKGKDAEVFVASDPRPADVYINQFYKRGEKKFGKENVPDKYIKHYEDAKDYHFKAMEMAKRIIAREDIYQANEAEGKKDGDSLKIVLGKLLTAIMGMWKLLGVGDLLEHEANKKDVGPYYTLEGRKGLQLHHVPQNALMDRISAWIISYLRPTETIKDEKTRARDEKRREKVLMDNGIIVENLKLYTIFDGICLYMAKFRHQQTRTFGIVPEGLRIGGVEKENKPRNLAETVEEAERTTIYKEAVGKFISAVKREFKKDKVDVENIYGGKKGMPVVKNEDMDQVKEAITELTTQNRKALGDFLE